MMIHPADLIGQYSLAEHIRFADEYFAKLREHVYLLQKPFYHPQNCAPSLANLAQLLGGLRLDYGMKVLDFAAGSCWLSRILVQMGCDATSCDVSETALDIGRELFVRYPPIADNPGKHDFLKFDGQSILAPHGHFDRIIVNDAFHHIPNPTTVLAEMHRVLRDDGIVAMSEPGRLHSRTNESQQEMETYHVIENDFIMEDIWEQARAIGFQYIEICPVLRQTYMSMEQYLECISGKVPPHVITTLVGDTYNHSIFFLYKKDPGSSSRVPERFTVLSQGDFDEGYYLKQYPDVANAIKNGSFANAWHHYEKHGRAEGRRGRR